MKAIYQSINDRSKIKAAFYNIRATFKDIRSYEKLLNTPILAAEMNEAKTREKINSLIKEAVNDLAAIEPLCKIYHELFAGEFEEIKTALHNSLTPINQYKPLNN